MFNEATFREILLASSENLNDYVVHISRKYADLDGNMGYPMMGDALKLSGDHIDFNLNIKNHPVGSVKS